MFEALAGDPDFEYLIIDSTIVRAHQHASGALKRFRRVATRYEMPPETTSSSSLSQQLCSG